MKGKKYTYSLLLMMCGHLFLGIAHISFLPPWEGFDETAHYSYIQQVADTYTLPRHGSARLSTDVQDYARIGPMPYRSLPPVDQNGGFTYKTFFESDAEVTENAKEFIHNVPVERWDFKEGSSANWQSQHPPFYYLLIAPIYSATKYLSLGKQVFILRFVSYVFAFFTLSIGLFTCLRQKQYVFQWVALGIVLWPLLFPSWFPEMARLGNDSLCALLVAVVFVILLNTFNNESLSFRNSIALGITLGLGCLTKGFFVPITVGVMGLWLLINWDKPAGKHRIKSLAYHLSLMILFIFCLSGWWYFLNLSETGVFLGSNEMIRLKNQGGLLSGLAQHFSLLSWIRGVAAFTSTLGWSGTWSMARPPYMMLIPMAFMFVLLCIIYLLTCFQSKSKILALIPAWFIVPTLLGFCYHVLVRMALTGQAVGTSGYYLHILVIPLGMAVGLSLKQQWHKTFFKVIGLGLFVYAIVFSIIITYAQLMLYAGIFYKAGSSKFYQLPGEMPAFWGIPESIQRLEVIAFPCLGLFSLFLGATVVIIGLCVIRKTKRWVS